MTAQGGPKRKKLAVKPKQIIKSVNKKIKVKPKASPIRVKPQERPGLKSDKLLDKVQKNTKAIQAKVKHERPIQMRRFSFVVRLMVDEDGQLGRTEIEDVSSNTKRNFPTLDGERLIAFMKAYIDPVIIPQDEIRTAPSPETASDPTPRPLIGPKSNLLVSDVQVFQTENPDLRTLILTPEEPFIVRARFQIQVPQAQFLTMQESSFEIKVYANEITSGESKLLTTYNAKLIQDILEYTAPVEVPGLPAGLYRLFTLVTLSNPIKVAGYHDGLVIQVV